MTIEEKYLELRKKKSVNRKITDTPSPTSKTDQNLAHTSRCLKKKLEPLRGTYRGPVGHGIA